MVIYTTKIYGAVCPPNISETVAGRLMKLAHPQSIASTTIKLIFFKCTVHYINFSKNNSANRRWPEAQIIAAIWFGRLRSQSRSPCPGFGQNAVAIYCAFRLSSLGDRDRSLGCRVNDSANQNLALRGQLLPEPGTVWTGSETIHTVSSYALHSSLLYTRFLHGVNVKC